VAKPIKIKDEHLILLLANLSGIFGGMFFLVISQPPTDLYYLLPVFSILGVIIANIILVILFQLSKEFKSEQTQNLPEFSEVSPYYKEGK
jgi:hypothetical protein